MKVLFVTRGFPSGNNPMSGNYEAVQAKAISAKGHEVSVIAIRWWNLRHFSKIKGINCRVVNGIRVYECDRLRLVIPHVYLPKIELWARKWQFEKIYKRYVKEVGKPDVVHAHIIMHAGPAIVLKEKYNLPFVITEHWSQMFKDNIPKRLLNDISIYKYADKVICVSESLAASLWNKYGVKSVVINNMVSDKFFDIDRQVKKHNDGKFRFITVGALREGKRIDMLVEAFALAQFSSNITLDIVGEGRQRPIIEDKIHECNVEDQVHLLGMRTPNEVNTLLCHSDCLILSSSIETFSIVLLEAMAKGLPVIATRCGGPETFVRPEDGVLVPKDNLEELSKAIKYMVEHCQDYNSEEIRQHCYDNFSQDVISDKIIDIYKQVTNK